MKLASLEDRRRLEVSTLEKEYEKIKELYKTDKTELSNEINRLRDEVDEINRKKVEIETRYDKDILLLKNEVQNEINIR
jgi:esterase/lipase